MTCHLDYCIHCPCSLFCISDYFAVSPLCSLCSLCYIGIVFIVLVHCSVFQLTLPSAHFAVCARCALFWYCIHCPGCNLRPFRVILVLYSLSLFVVLHFSLLCREPTLKFCSLRVILVLHSLSLFIVLYFILLCRQTTFQSVLVPCCLVFVCCLHFGNHWFCS